jgi:hypothetical protein
LWNCSEPEDKDAEQISFTFFSVLRYAFSGMASPWRWQDFSFKQKSSRSRRDGGRLSLRVGLGFMTHGRDTEAQIDTLTAKKQHLVDHYPIMQRRNASIVTFPIPISIDAILPLCEKQFREFFVR